MKEIGGIVSYPDRRAWMSAAECELNRATFGETKMNMRYENATIRWAEAHHIQRTSERRSPEHTHSLALAGAS